MTVFGHGVFEPVAYHGIFRGVAVILKEVVYCLICALAVEIIGVYNCKGTVNHTAAAQHRVTRTPRLFPALGNTIALGKLIKLLIHILYIEIFLHPAAHGSLEAVLNFMLNYEGDLFEPRPAGIEQRKVDYRMAAVIHGGYLL